MRRPIAEFKPGKGGINTFLIFNWRANSTACSTSTCKRFKYELSKINPLSTETFRIHRTIEALTTRMMPSANSSTLNFNGEASVSFMQLWAKSLSSLICPPRNHSGLSRPKTRFASVTVGAVPTLSIAYRTRVSACALRTNPKGPTIIDPCDTASSCTNRFYIDHGYFYRQPIYFTFFRSCKVAIENKADIKACPPMSAVILSLRNRCFPQPVCFLKHLQQAPTKWYVHFSFEPLRRS